MKVDDAFHGISTLVTAGTSMGQVQGSAFFYQRLAPKEGDGPQWREVKDTWLITNRHVVIPRFAGDEIVPDTFTINLRKLNGGRVQWDPLTLNRDELLDRARFHRDSAVDVAAIRVFDLLVDRLKSEEGSKYLQWYAVHKDAFAGENNITVEVGDEALVIGYPRGFYDEVNLFPIVKAGVIASRWGAYFNGNPYFLIDAKLFPGSSGSVVVSRPCDIAVVEGRILLSKEKQFAFLGIYSGELVFEEKPLELDDLTIVRKLGFNVGVVWYAELVEEIASNGVPYSPAV